MKRKQGSAPSSTFEFEDFAKLSVAASFSYFGVMSNALQKDTRRCMDICLDLKAKIPPGEQSVDQESYTDLNFWYPNLVRAFVTEVEGLLFVMRRIAVWAHDRGEIDMSTAEAVLARETEYRIDVRRKRVEERERSNRLLENFIWLFLYSPGYSELTSRSTMAIKVGRLLRRWWRLEISSLIPSHPRIHCSGRTCTMQFPGRQHGSMAEYLIC